MAYATNRIPIYAKGTMDVWLFNPNTFDLEFYSSKVQTNNLTTDTNMGEINGSLRNPVLLSLPDSADLSLEITMATSSLDTRKISVGGEMTYNGVYPVLETIRATGSQLTVGQTPVAPYGTNTAYAFINKDGTAYTINPDTKTVNGFTATAGKTYCVRYFTRAASARQLKIGSAFNPDIEVCMIRIPLYTTELGDASTRGTRWGDRYIWIPRLQARGQIDVNGSQTEADAETLSFRALPYEEALAEGVCLDESSFAIAYMVDMPAEGPWALVEGIAVPGGGITAPLRKKVKVPFVYLMSDGSVVPIPYSEQLEETDFYVTVDEDPTAGEVTITQTLADGTVVRATQTGTNPSRVLHAYAIKEVGRLKNVPEKEEDLIDTTRLYHSTDDGYVEWTHDEEYVIQDGSEISMDEDGYLEQTYDDGAVYSAARLSIDADGDMIAAQTNIPLRYVSCEFTIAVVA